MKTILIVILLAGAFSGGACSRSNQLDTGAQTNPNPSLKSDVERLHQATAKAAEERKRAQAQGSPTPAASLP